MAKFLIDTTDNNISKSMLEMILENSLDYKVYVTEVKEIDETNLNELADKVHLRFKHILAGSTLGGLTEFEKRIYKEGYRDGHKALI